MKIATNPVLDWRRFDELSAILLYELLQFRQGIFVVEQKSPFADLDGLDQRAWHLMLRWDGSLAGCLRLIAHEDKRRLAIGRVAVAPALRGRRLARRMMDEALLRCRRDHPGWQVALSAQTYLVPFYTGLGFVASSAPYDDCGVPHIDMISQS
jgi:ElaA protein